MSLADRIAGTLGARKAGGWWRTSTAHCHGGDTADGLAFRSPNDDPENLFVYCYSRNCHESMEGRNRARDNLRAAAGLPPWQPSRAYSSAQTVKDGQKQRKGSGIPYKRPNAVTDGPRQPVTAPEALQGHFQAPIGANKSAESRSKRKSARNHNGDSAAWGAHMLPWDDDAGCHSHAAACPECGKPDALIAWTLTDHPFPYCGLALKCSCALSYDQLHKHIAGQLAAKDYAWRQQAFYTLPGGRRRARVRIDPGKSVFWDTAEGRGSTAGYAPAFWYSRRGVRADCGRALIVEGEKAAAACVSAGIDAQLAIYSIGGIAAFKSTDFAAFGNGCEVTIWPDNHTEGQAAGNVAAARLAALGAGIQIVNVIGLPEKGDAADIAAAEIRKRIHNARKIA